MVKPLSATPLPKALEAATVQAVVDALVPLAAETGVEDPARAVSAATSHVARTTSQVAELGTVRLATQTQQAAKVSRREDGQITHIIYQLGGHVDGGGIME